MDDIIIDYTNVMADAVGQDNGLTEQELAALGKKSAASLADLLLKRKEGALPFFDLPSQTDMVKEVEKVSKRLRKKFSTMVVLGIGGSALGTIALMNALRPHNHNQLSTSKRGGMRLIVADNIDPDWFATQLKSVKLKETVFCVISKSGSTAETMSQFMIVADLLKKKIGKSWTRHMVIITDQKSGVLRPIADKHKITSLAVPDGVGGRFTVFTPVSLLPAACAGIDIKKLLAGAAQMAGRATDPDPDKNPAALFAALHYLLDTSKGKKMTVMMPYSSRLYMVADWFRQLWAESLGKREDLQGNPVYAGQTPIKALGATDQHSQVQLYVEGPFDKVVVFLDVKEYDTPCPIPKSFGDYPAISYLGGSSLAELVAVEKRGTEYALTSNSRPNMTLLLPRVDEGSVGQVLYLLEVATAVAGGLYNIDPFDQPGVEFGKQYAYAMMGREGFADKKTVYQKSEAGERKVL